MIGMVNAIKKRSKKISFLSRYIKLLLNNSIIPTLLACKTNLFFPWRRQGRDHGLNRKLIVSLTSYPPRFKTLHLTLKSLLMQDIKADKIILWISYSDEKLLTPEVLALKNYGVDIRFCEDLRSYKKIIPTLKEFPDDYIVTTDDDVFYWNNWLSQLVSEHKVHSDAVICHRARLVQLDADEKLCSYNTWPLQESRSELSPLNFQTGVGGVLYPPNIFYKDVLDIDLFKNLCFHADDAWLYWMTRLNKKNICSTLNSDVIYNWPSSQNESLFKKNVDGGGNDIQVKNLVDHYGFPRG